MVCNKTGVVFSVSTVQMILLLSMNHATASNSKLILRAINSNYNAL